MSIQCKYLRLLFLCLPLILLGCAQAYGPRFQPQKIEANKSLVYIYRKGSFSSAILAMSPMIMINGEPYRTLKPRGHVPILLAPGEYDISLHGAHFGRITGGEVASIKLNAEQGKTSYLCYEVNVTAVHTRGNAEWTEVEPLLFFETPSQGVQSLQNTRLLPVNKTN